MSLTWTAPAALWLLAALPLVWAVHTIARTNFNTTQRVVQAVVRSLLLAALAVALARPILSSTSSRQSVVYAVDVSHSIATHGIEAAAKKIDELNANLKPSHSRIVAFGRSATAVASTTALGQLADVQGEKEAERIDRTGTDLEAALDAARGELAPEHVPRVVLFTDGHPTAGDTAEVVSRLAAEHIPVFVEPIAQRSLADAWIDTVDVADRITAGATFMATVNVMSQHDGAGELELRSAETVLAKRPVAFRKGLTAIPIEATVDAPGPYVLEAALSVKGDALAANNTYSRETWADPRAKVLYVEGVPASARYLSGALTASGFDVTVRPATAVASVTTNLDAFDLVILSDIDRKAIPDASMNALADWVEKSGGGLLLAGGEAVFGEGGGYRKTSIERLMPVTFERKDEPEVALVLVLDRSWSMAGSSMELTKTAAQAAIDVLKDEQLVGILTFNDKFDWDVTVRNVGRNRDLIRKKIAAIGPGGHTLIYPAVEQSYFALRSAKARAKHVILLSDGRSYPGDYETLVRKMVEANITVSTVAVGPSADPELLKNLATWGKGRAYVVADASQVAEIFVKEAKNAASPGFDEKAFTPKVKTPGFLAGIDLTHMPLLKGRTATVLKDGAMELVATDEDDPLLAFWPIGMGRTAVFASDVKDRWAADWIRWRGYGPFFTSVARALQRQRSPAVALEVDPGAVRGKSRTISVAVEARDPGGQYKNLLNPAVLVRAAGPKDAGTTPARLITRQIAPGRYQATVVADADRAVNITVEGTEGTPVTAGITSRTILPDPAAEYRFRPPNETLLKSIAAATGGMWHPTAAAMANGAGDSRTERRPLWPALIVLALVLWFVDLLLRRVRIFEPVVETT